MVSSHHYSRKHQTQRAQGKIFEFERFCDLMNFQENNGNQIFKIHQYVLALYEIN